MEDFGKYQLMTSSVVQNTIAQWVLELAEIGEYFEREGSLPLDAYKSLLHRTLVLVLLLEDAIRRRFPELEGLLTALMLYRIDKQAYAEQGFPHKVVAIYENSRTKKRINKVYHSIKLFPSDVDRLKNKEYDLVFVDIFPADDLLRDVIRAIIITARDYGILAFQIQPKPSYRVIREGTKEEPNEPSLEGVGEGEVSEETPEEEPFEEEYEEVYEEEEEDGEEG